MPGAAGDLGGNGGGAVNIAYNVDCMEYMAKLPDNAFDLAVVDPPYADGHSQSVHVERESGTGSEGCLIGTKQIPRAGWHGKKTYGKK